MSQSGSGMTLSSSASQGFHPVSGETGSAMPKATIDQWSEGSSAGGSRGGADFFHEAVKRFDEQSRVSDSMDGDHQAHTSSESASMTKEESQGHSESPAPFHRRIVSEAKAKACSFVKKAMPSLGVFTGRERSTASSSQGPRTPILPTMTATLRG